MQKDIYPCFIDREKAFEEFLKRMFGTVRKFNIFRKDIRILK